MTSFTEIPLWRLEVQPEKLPDFLDDESVRDEQNVEMTNETKLVESNDTSDKMTKTSSYGAMANDQLNVPPVHVSQLLIFNSNSV